MVAAIRLQVSLARVCYQRELPTQLPPRKHCKRPAVAPVLPPSSLSTHGQPSQLTAVCTERHPSILLIHPSTKSLHQPRCSNFISCVRTHLRSLSPNVSFTHSAACRNDHHGRIRHLRQSDGLSTLVGNKPRPCHADIAGAGLSIPPRRRIPRGSTLHFTLTKQRYALTDRTEITNTKYQCHGTTPSVPNT
jgi:hypothetical protein